MNEIMLFLLNIGYMYSCLYTDLPFETTLVKATRIYFRAQRGHPRRAAGGKGEKERKEPGTILATASRIRFITAARHGNTSPGVDTGEVAFTP
jgi:hypothetical protein